jgi:hypothetical protein
MGFFDGAAGILAIIAIFIILPKTIISFVSNESKHKREMELAKMKYQKEILELELEKQRAEIKLLEEENKKYDNIINNS